LFIIITYLIYELSLFLFIHELSPFFSSSVSLPHPKGLLKNSKSINPAYRQAGAKVSKGLCKIAKN
jgi:hypothetical protein